jgi:hypothetical protein
VAAPLLESTGTTIERALDDAIARLARAPSTTATKTLLIEARRLKALMGSWGAIPPPAEARREMLARVMHVAADAGAAVASLPPSLGTPASPSAPSDPCTGSRPVTPSVRRAGSSLPAEWVAADAVEWQPSSVLVGVSSKLLHWDSAQGLFTALVRLDPGAELPAHRHAALEELFVLEGSLRAGNARGELLRAHAYCRSEIGNAQPFLATEKGCLLLLVGSERSEVLA